jgi:hypothetical protein
VIANRLLAADATKAIVAAPGVGSRLRIFAVTYSIRVAAAQVIDLGVDGGTPAQQMGAIAASAVAPGQILSEAGFTLPENTALSAKPALAGPEVQFLVEYIIEPKTSVTA